MKQANLLKFNKNRNHFRDANIFNLKVHNFSYVSANFWIFLKRLIKYSGGMNEHKNYFALQSTSYVLRESKTRDHVR